MRSSIVVLSWSFSFSFSLSFSFSFSISLSLSFFSALPVVPDSVDAAAVAFCVEASPVAEGLAADDLSAAAVEASLLRPVSDLRGGIVA